MAAVAPAADQATGLLQKLSLETKTKTHDAPEVTKKNTAIPAHERSMTPAHQSIESNMCYFPNGYMSQYYFGGYDSINDWEDYSRYINPEGVEMAPPGVYGDIYHTGYGYTPYGAYPSPGSPAPTMGHDGQMYGPQHYQYPAPYYQSPSPANAPYTNNQAPKSKDFVSTSAAPDHAPISLDAAKGNANGVANGTANGNNGLVAPKPSQQNSMLASNCYGGALPNGLPSSGHQDPRFSFDGMRSPVPWFDAHAYPDAQHRLTTNNAVSLTGSHANSTSGRNQNMHPLPFMGLHNPRPTSGMGPGTPGLVNRMYPNNRMYNAYSTGLGFRSNFYDSVANGRWGVMDKYKPRGQGNGFYGYANVSMDGLSELNRGPRANHNKNPKGFGPNLTIAVKGQTLPNNGNVDNSSLVPDKDQYNKADFPVDYADAKFFIIKSYSEDDIHKSVKYNVWASTPNGNKKLDGAYRDAQHNPGGCPVFLFFSVNTSGQFVGVAEMVGPVDFNKTVDYWQQDKWTGCFPVKWHIVKDVPNNILRPIILENNDNKPVTNSRDTQDVKLEQGLQMLKLFKEHVGMTSILDDFGFYETRQKVMQEKRAKQHQLHKQVMDGKPVDAVDVKEKDVDNGKPRLQKPLEAVTVLKKGTNLVGLGERKPDEENGLTPVTAAGEDIADVAKPSTEKKVVTNGVTVVANGVTVVANGC